MGKEIVIKITSDFIGFKPHRDLLCDGCSKIIYSKELEDDFEFYAVFWQDSSRKRESRIYLEQYICSNCATRYYKKKIIPPEKVEEVFVNAVKENLKRNWHGILVSCSSVKEWELLSDNPFLIEFWGEKF